VAPAGETASPPATSGLTTLVDLKGLADLIVSASELGLRCDSLEDLSAGSLRCVGQGVSVALELDDDRSGLGRLVVGLEDPSGSDATAPPDLPTAMAIARAVSVLAIHP
jgi:hypothetical protein